MAGLIGRPMPRPIDLGRNRVVAAEILFGQAQSLWIGTDRAESKKRKPKLSPRSATSRFCKMVNSRKSKTARCRLGQAPVLATTGHY